MRRTCITLFFVGALAAAGCGGSDDTSDIGAEPAATTIGDDSSLDGEDEPAADDDQVDSDGAQVELVDPGAEPRQLLRLHPVVGTTQQFTVRQESALEQTGATGVPAVSSRSVIESDIDSEVTAATDTFEVASNYADVRVVEASAANALAPLEDLRKQMVGRTSTATYSTRGEVIASEADLPETDNQVLDQMLSSFESQSEQLAVPFPEDAVGVGAVWTRSAQVEVAMGISMSTTTTFTLLAIDGDHVRARQESRVVMAGSAATDIDGELNGVGFVEWDLKLPCPTASSMQIGGTITIAMGGVELEQTQTQVMQLTSR